MTISRWKIMACALALSLGGLAFVAGPMNNRLDSQGNVAAQERIAAPGPDPIAPVAACPVAEKSVVVPAAVEAAPPTQSPQDIEIIFPVAAPPAPVAPMIAYEPIQVPEQPPMAGVQAVTPIANFQIPDVKEAESTSEPETLPPPYEIVEQQVITPPNMPQVVAPLNVPTIVPVDVAAEKKEKVDRLMKKFKRLTEEHKFEEAGKVALKAKEIDPDNPSVIAAITISSMGRTHQKWDNDNSAAPTAVPPPTIAAPAPRAEQIDSGNYSPTYPAQTKVPPPSDVPPPGTEPVNAATQSVPARPVQRPETQPWDVTGEETNNTPPPYPLQQAEVPSYAPVPQMAPAMPPPTGSAVYSCPTAYPGQPGKRCPAAMPTTQMIQSSPAMPPVTCSMPPCPPLPFATTQPPTPAHPIALFALYLQAPDKRSEGTFYFGPPNFNPNDPLHASHVHFYLWCASGSIFQPSQVFCYPHATLPPPPVCQNLIYVAQLVSPYSQTPSELPPMPVAPPPYVPVPPGTSVMGPGTTVMGPQEPLSGAYSAPSMPATANPTYSAQLSQPPIPLQQAAAVRATNLRMLLRLGDGKPRFEIRSSDGAESLFKVSGEKIELQNAAQQTSPIAGVTAIGQVRFVGPGIEGTCDQLTVLSGTGELLLKGNVQMKAKHGKTWNEISGDKIVYQVTASGVSLPSSSNGVTPASYNYR